jgi:hypothetical protein
MNRRNFLRLGLGAAAVIAAPVLVERASIMAIKPARPDTIIGLMLRLEEEVRRDALFPDNERWMIISEDAYKHLIGFDLAKPGSDQTVIVHRNLEIGQIDRFTFYESPPIVASNYGRGPGLLSEDARGVRSWEPEQIKMRQAERTIRSILEPHRSKRWV